MPEQNEYAKYVAPKPQREDAIPLWEQRINKIFKVVRTGHSFVYLEGDTPDEIIRTRRSYVEFVESDTSATSTEPQDKE